MVKMDDEATGLGLEGEGDQERGALEAARKALEEAQRRAHRLSPTTSEPGDTFDPARVAYEMELAEHRNTAERLQRAELAVRDVTIQYQQARIEELEAEVARLRTALQVLTGLGLPGTKPAGPGEARER
jgi:DNA repair exonuclease SbcCD ATPase subunit